MLSTSNNTPPKLPQISWRLRQTVHHLDFASPYTTEYNRIQPQSTKDLTRWNERRFSTPLSVPYDNDAYNWSCTITKLVEDRNVTCRPVFYFTNRWSFSIKLNAWHPCWNHGRTDLMNISTCHLSTIIDGNVISTSCYRYVGIYPNESALPVKILFGLSSRFQAEKNKA